MDEKHFMAAMVDAALKAADIIRQHYAQTITVYQKADLSPVTEADREAELIITVRLKQSLGDVAIVAEEQIACGFCPDISAGCFFLIDPLDGTREFVARNDEFSVNIALIKGQRPVIGVIALPALNEIYVGSKAGAYKASIKPDGQCDNWQSIFCRAAGEKPVIVTSRSHRSKETDAWIKTQSSAFCQPMGSAIKFCRVAQGDADFYPRFEHCMEWDTAAGDALIHAAGGAVVGLDGKPLLYGRKEQDFRQNFFIAYGKGALKM